MARIPFVSRNFGAKPAITRDGFEGEAQIKKTTPMRPVERPVSDGGVDTSPEEQALIDHAADRAAFLKASAERGDVAPKVATPAQPKG